MKKTKRVSLRDPKLKSQIRRLKATLRKSNIPSLARLSSGVEGGMEILDYMFKVTDAAEGVKTPKGIVVKAVAIENIDPKRAVDIEFARFTLDAIQLGPIRAGLRLQLGDAADELVKRTAKKIQTPDGIESTANQGIGATKS